MQRLTDMSESAREHGSFIYKMEQMDKLRGEDWRQSCPEIHKGFLENGIVNK